MASSDDAFSGLDDELPESVILPDPGPEQPDATGTEKVCLGCGNPIYREPGSRGRLPRYHPECRPLKSASGGSGTTVRRTRSGKAEAESAELISSVKSRVMPMILLLAAVDQFDAMAVMVNLDNLFKGLQGVLARHDTWRKAAMNGEGAADILLILTSIAGMVFPMLAHHGFLGKARMAQFMVNLPHIIMRMNDRLQTSGQDFAKMMAEEMTRAQQANARKPNPVQDVVNDVVS